MAESADEVAGAQTDRSTGERPSGSEASGPPRGPWLEAVIVGLDGREHDADAIALGRSIQAALGGTICLAHVIPPGPPGQGRMALEALEREDGTRLLVQAAEALDGRIETELIDPVPAAEGLAWLAANRPESMLVVGSSHRGPVGRIVPGGVASRLLARAPCAIAVAPRGYARVPRAPAVGIGAAYNATPESDVALAAAAAAASRLAVPLRVYHAVDQDSDSVASDDVPTRTEDLASDIVAAALRQLPPELEATGSVLSGDAAAVIAEAADDDDVSFLYVGSRGYGPLREAVFHGVAGSLLRAARCPLVIFPPRSRPAVGQAGGVSPAGSRILICPACRGEMRTHERGGVLIDECEDCRGIFLDRGEIERLMDAADQSSRHEVGGSRRGRREGKSRADASVLIADMLVLLASEPKHGKTTTHRSASKRDRR